MTISTPQANAGTDETRLLLQFLAQVQETGLCGYPPLEAHLHRYAEVLRRQADEAAAAPRTASEDTADTATEPDAEAMPASPEATDSTPASQDLETMEHQDAPAQGLDPASQGGSELNLPNRKQVAGRQGPEERQQGQSPADWAQTPSGSECAATDRDGSPALVARAHAARADHGETTDPGDASTAASTPIQPSFEPDLDLLLRFREQVQSSGFCDHPDLQERLAAHQGNRELPQGSSSEDTALQPNLCALMSVATGLSQRRQLLGDGVASYGVPIDVPQRRMLQRQLARAERSDRQIRRMLTRAAGDLDFQLKGISRSDCNGSTTHQASPGPSFAAFPAKASLASRGYAHPSHDSHDQLHTGHQDPRCHPHRRQPVR